AHGTLCRWLRYRHHGFLDQSWRSAPKSFSAWRKARRAIWMSSCFSLSISSCTTRLRSLWPNHTPSLSLRRRWAATRRSPMVLPFMRDFLRASSSSLSALMTASGQVALVPHSFCRSCQRRSNLAVSSFGARKRRWTLEVRTNSNIATSTRPVPKMIRVLLNMQQLLCFFGDTQQRTVGTLRRHQLQANWQTFAGACRDTDGGYARQVYGYGHNVCQIHLQGVIGVLAYLECRAWRRRP